jgi:hypothetical protein
MEIPMSKVNSFSEQDVIGSGSTGQVFRKGSFAYKSASKTEAEIYRLISDKPGISPGILEGDKIVTSYYPMVISVDTIKHENRFDLSQFIWPNIDRINKAVSYLISTGYEYSDPLQFGLAENGTMDLLDFSNGNNNFPSDVITNNLGELARFYHTFGLSYVGDAVSITESILSNQRSRAKSSNLFDFFGDCFDDINYRDIHNDLNGLPAKYAYYTYDTEVIPGSGFSQTLTNKGCMVILSLDPLSSDVVFVHNLVLVFFEPSD